VTPKETGVNSDRQRERLENSVASDTESLPSRTENLVCFLARHPGKCLATALLLSLVISVFVALVGELKVTTETKGWKSRGTLLSNRQMQDSLVRKFKNDLFFNEYLELPRQEEQSPWDYIVNNIVTGYMGMDGEEDLSDDVQPSTFNTSTKSLQSQACYSDHYLSPDFIFYNHLIAAWKSDPKEDDDESASFSILDPEAMLEICEAELNTNLLLQEKGYCGDCAESNHCPPPNSIIMLLRNFLAGPIDFKSSLDLANLLSIPCSNLIEMYRPLRSVFTNMLVACTNDVKNNFDSATQELGNVTLCPQGFSPNMVDVNFGVGDNTFLRYSASYFNTFDLDLSDKENDIIIEKMYDILKDFDRADETIVLGVYDTNYGNFNAYFTNEVLLADVSFAFLSAAVTMLAMIVHTRSLWLSLLGILQIILSIPMAYFMYYFIFGLKFFPILNLIGLFVSAALGADDVFVVVDKWKSARLENPEGCLESIAKIALPDAASAMFLTTSTTAVAFFATCICPVPPIFTFALFCGLLIILNYILNCLFLFPGLCLYDRWLTNGSKNCLITFYHLPENLAEQHSPIQENQNGLDESQREQSLMHSILSTLYTVIHSYRVVILVLSLISIAVSAYFASTIRQPQVSDVRLLPSKNPLEMHYEWNKLILTNELFFASGSSMRTYWGIIPADEGKHRDPDTLSNLALDEQFDPSSEAAQEYLLGFCDDLFMNDFVQKPSADFKCEINRFDSWLQKQSSSDEKDNDYIDACRDADSLPMAEDLFHSCIIHWSKVNKEKNILSKDGIVKIMRVDSRSPVIQYSQSMNILKEEWNKFENWFEIKNSLAPLGVDQMFHACAVWWWYDTNAQMLSTAFGAAMIAVGFSGFMVLISTRSFILTLISAICIAYVLAAATASLVSLGWELGFLQSVCFAILIGISCDFVIHFGHAYNHLPGSRTKEERTKHALLHMGPSILAAAVTSMSSAIFMLFCRVTFFTQFAEMLLLTMTHAIIGSFVVYLVHTDTYGPDEPTKFVQSIVTKITLACGARRSSRGEL